MTSHSEPHHSKMVIVMRKDLNMRKGKMIAQGAHAAIGAAMLAEGSDEYGDWLTHGTAKICVSVDSELELMAIFIQAKEAKLPVELITDSGRTEFAGVPTKTCLAIGPARADAIDKITGNLKLL